MPTYFKHLLSLACLFVATNVFAEGFRLSTSAFRDKERLPVLYSCDGRDISPQIAWTGSPPGTKTFVLIMSDPAASKGTFYHWILFNIPNKTTIISQGMVKAIPGSLLGQNDFGKNTYSGPCPPKGSVHTYHFTVYALDTSLPLNNGASANAVLQAMQKHIIGQNELTALYSH